VSFPRLRRFPISDLDEGVGIVERRIPRAAKKALLVLSLRRDEALEDLLEVIPAAVAQER